MDEGQMVRFKFILGQGVKVVGTDIVGRVNAFFHGKGGGSQMLVKYLDGDGNIAETYFHEDELEAE